MTIEVLHSKVNLYSQSQITCGSIKGPRVLKTAIFSNEDEYYQVSSTWSAKMTGLKSPKSTYVCRSQVKNSLLFEERRLFVLSMRICKEVDVKIE